MSMRTACESVDIGTDFFLLCANQNRDLERTTNQQSIRRESLRPRGVVLRKTTPGARLLRIKTFQARKPALHHPSTGNAECYVDDKRFGWSFCGARQSQRRSRRTECCDFCTAYPIWSYTAAAASYGRSKASLLTDPSAHGLPAVKCAELIDTEGMGQLDRAVAPTLPSQALTGRRDQSFHFHRSTETHSAALPAYSLAHVLKATVRPFSAESRQTCHQPGDPLGR